MEVAAEARAALIGKSAHLSLPAEADDVAGTDEVSAESVGVFTVDNPHGLHARPAARLVSEVRVLDATVHLRNLSTGAGPVPAGSLSRVATLAALRGHQVEIRASGHQADEAVEHILALAERRFDEADGDTVSPPPAVAAVQRNGPLPASPGIAIGPARQPDCGCGRSGPAPGRRSGCRVATPRRVGRGSRSRDRARARPHGSRRRCRGGQHLRSAPVPARGHRHARRRQGQDRAQESGAIAAWTDSVADVQRVWADLPDPYLRERAADVQAVGAQVLRALTREAAPHMSAYGVLVATDLTPAETASLDLDLVAGVVLAEGAPRRTPPSWPEHATSRSSWPSAATS